MTGKKVFINKTNKDIRIVLFIREGSTPNLQAGIQRITLVPGEKRVVEYGNRRNIYLNGLQIRALKDKKVLSRELYVDIRGDFIDDLLNQNRYINVIANNNKFDIHGFNKK